MKAKDILSTLGVNSNFTKTREMVAIDSKDKKSPYFLQPTRLTRFNILSSSFSILLQMKSIMQPVMLVPPRSISRKFVSNSSAISTEASDTPKHPSITKI